MGRFYVVIVCYVLFGYSSCAPKIDRVTLLLTKACPNVKGLDKVLPTACNEKEVPPECEIMVDYIVRLCKRDGFSFNPNSSLTWTCPLSLPPIEHEEFIKNHETRSVMERLSNNSTCVSECSGNGVQLCGKLSDLALLIKQNAPPKTSNPQLPPKPDKLTKPAPQQEAEKQSTLVKPEESSPVDAPIIPQPVVTEASVPPPPPPQQEPIPATTKSAKPPPIIPQLKEENPEPSTGIEKVEIKPVEPDSEMELDPEQNVAGHQSQDDYAQDDLADTESKTVKPFSKVDSQFAEVSTAIHSNGPFQEAPDSHFFVYFLFFTCISVIGYIAFHNKNKLLALALEGRRGRQGRKRPNSASYRKLDNSLEEAIMSNPSRASNSPVIF